MQITSVAVAQILSVIASPRLMFFRELMVRSRRSTLLSKTIFDLRLHLASFMSWYSSHSIPEFSPLLWGFQHQPPRRRSPPSTTSTGLRGDVAATYFGHRAGLVPGIADIPSGS